MLDPSAWIPSALDAKAVGAFGLETFGVGRQSCWSLRLGNVGPFGLETLRALEPSASFCGKSDFRLLSFNFKAMATIKRFEDLRIWQLARQQCQSLFPFLQSKDLAADRALQSQMNRSSASVMDNIAEGFDRFSRADFRHFLVMARGSNAELRSQLYRCADRSYLQPEALHAYLSFSIQIGAKITAFIKYLDKCGYETKPKDPTPYVSEPGLPACEPEPAFLDTISQYPEA